MSTSTARVTARADDDVSARAGTTSIANSLLAMAALGAGLVLVATGAGSSPVGAVPLVVLGVGALLWAVVVLVRDRVPGLRASFVGAVGTVVVWVTLYGLASVGVTTVPPFLPTLSSTVLLLTVAGVLARRLRRLTLASTAPEELELDELVAHRSRRPHRAPSTGRYVLTLLAGAAVVAALTTPALAQTRAGEFAVPHGSLHSSH
jgi:hypothetical protein